jgi:hypothetical protein
MPRDAAGRLGAVRPVLKVEPGMLDVIASETEQAIMRAGLPVYQRGRTPRPTRRTGGVGLSRSPHSRRLLQRTDTASRSRFPVTC